LLLQQKIELSLQAQINILTHSANLARILLDRISIEHSIRWRENVWRRGGSFFPSATGVIIAVMITSARYSTDIKCLVTIIARNYGST